MHTTTCTSKTFGKINIFTHGDWSGAAYVTYKDENEVEHEWTIAGWRLITGEIVGDQFGSVRTYDIRGGVSIDQPVPLVVITCAVAASATKYASLFVDRALSDIDLTVKTSLQKLAKFCP